MNTTPLTLHLNFCYKTIISISNVYFKKQCFSFIIFGKCNFHVTTHTARTRTLI